MIEQANREETAYILSNAALSANEGLKGTGVLTQERQSICLPLSWKRGRITSYTKIRIK